MSADSSEKSFDATPSRIAKARREGNTARSQELGANLAFLAAVVATVAVAPFIGAQAKEAIAASARGERPAMALLAIVAYAFVPIAAGAIGGIVASIGQTGGLIVVGVGPKFEKIAPADGFKRIFSRETVTHAARALIAFAISSMAIAASIRDAFGAANAVGDPRRFAALAWAGAEHAVLAAIAVGLVFSVAEYAVARKAWLSKLKMSLHELKRDLKEREGDPHARARRKSFHRNLIRGSLARVKDAAFVVVNPTHVAVALEYRPPDVPVPMVLVRASDEGALRVREEAKLHRVPVVENIPLARSLYAQASVGEAIPHDHYVAVAEIVAALTREGILS